MVFVVGLTGNIASGKTTVAEIFSSFGIQVFSADAISRALTAKDTHVYHAIIEYFGTSVLLENKELNRARLRSIIFSEPQKRSWLEHLLHPLIRKELQSMAKNCTTAYCVIEIPLLLDKTSYPYINRVLVILAPPHLQIARVMERDQCSEKEALAILAAQPSDSSRLKIADDTIINDQGLDVLRAQLINLDYQYRMDAAGLQ